jgi:hypothetical protein
MRLTTGLLLWLALSVVFGQTTTHPAETAQAPASGSADTWTALSSLVGTWSGEGTGDPGPGTGGFSFSWELQQKILVRKSHAEYPAADGRPAFSHQDLTIVYRDTETGLAKAFYLDNEGHVIDYVVTVSPDAKSIVFLSELKPSTPRYRLTYVMTSTEKVEMAFEIAPPDKPDSFRTYLQAGARRQ